MDTYEFKGAEKKGEIDGNTLNATEARGIYFAEKFILSAIFFVRVERFFKGEK